MQHTWNWILNLRINWIYFLRRNEKKKKKRRKANTNKHLRAWDDVQLFSLSVFCDFHVCERGRVAVLVRPFLADATIFLFISIFSIVVSSAFVYFFFFFFSRFFINAYTQCNIKNGKMRLSFSFSFSLYSILVTFLFCEWVSACASAFIRSPLFLNHSFSVHPSLWRANIQQNTNNGGGGEQSVKYVLIFSLMQIHIHRKTADRRKPCSCNESVYWECAYVFIAKTSCYFR